MPKAYDDESEFENEVIEKLSKLTLTERLKYLARSKLLPVTFSILLGFLSFFYAVSAVFHYPSILTTNPNKNPLIAIGQRLSEQGLKIGLASDEIRKAAQTLPPGEAQTHILEQQRIIEEEAVALKAYGEAMAEKDKRSAIDLFTPAYADNPPSTKLTPDDVRLYGIVTILMTLGVAFILCIGIILFSDHARRLTFAIDTVKVLMGFFVGVATSFFGVR